jgi:hypothetical protein
VNSRVAVDSMESSRSVYSSLVNTQISCLLCGMDVEYLLIHLCHPVSCNSVYLSQGSTNFPKI